MKYSKNIGMAYDMGDIMKETMNRYSDNIFCREMASGLKLVIKKVPFSYEAMYEVIIYQDERILSEIVLNEKDFRSFYGAIDEYNTLNPYRISIEFDNKLVYAGNTLKISLKGIYRNGDKVKLLFICDNSTTAKNIYAKKIEVNNKGIKEKYKTTLKNDGESGFDVEVSSSVLEEITKISIKLGVQTIDKKGKIKGEDSSPLMNLTIDWNKRLVNFDIEEFKQKIIETPKKKKIKVNANKKSSKKLSGDNFLNYKSFVVYYDKLTCKGVEHQLDEIKAVIDIYNPTTNQIVRKRVDACYCYNCKVYYIESSIFKILDRQGIILCQMISQKDYQNIKNKGKGPYSDFNPQHLLNRCGYNVNASTNLSEKARRIILDRVIQSGLMSKMEVVNHLKGCIELHKTPQNKKAREKWNSDIQYLTGKNIEVGIGKIVVSDKIEDVFLKRTFVVNQKYINKS